MNQVMQDYLRARVTPLTDLAATSGNPVLAERAEQIAVQMEQLAEQCGDPASFEAQFAACGLVNEYNQVYVDAYTGGGTSSLVPEPSGNPSTTPEFTEADIQAMRDDLGQKMRRGMVEDAVDIIGFEIAEDIKSETIYPARRKLYEEMLHTPVIGDMMQAENVFGDVARSKGGKLFGRRKKRDQGDGC